MREGLYGYSASESQIWINQLGYLSTAPVLSVDKAKTLYGCSGWWGPTIFTLSWIKEHRCTLCPSESTEPLVTEVHYSIWCWDHFEWKLFGEEMVIGLIQATKKKKKDIWETN